MTDGNGQPNPARPGVLIAFEGIDGSGKSTQVSRIAAWIRAGGREAVTSAEPTRGRIGQEIRRLAREGRLDAQREFELFRDDRAQHARELIRPALDRGAVVLLDRYYISSIAYQGARGLDPEVIRAENEGIAPRPDLVIIFEVAVDEAMRRLTERAGEAGADLFERRDYQERVAENFARLDWPEVRRVDSSKGADALEADLRAILGPVVFANPH